MVEDVGLEVVVQAALVVVVGDQQHLGPAARALDVGRDEAEDVLVAHEDGLVDLGLAEPGGLLGGEEDLDSHPLPPPPGQPDLAVPGTWVVRGGGMITMCNVMTGMVMLRMVIMMMRAVS